MEESYLVISRRYRPKRFSEVIGQEAIITTLKHALKKKRVERHKKGIWTEDDRSRFYRGFPDAGFQVGFVFLHDTVVAIAEAADLRTRALLS